MKTIQPIMFWYDRNHIARKSTYLNVLKKWKSNMRFFEDEFG